MHLACNFCQNYSYGNKKKQKTKKESKQIILTHAEKIENWLYPFPILVSRLLQNHFS